MKKIIIILAIFFLDRVSKIYLLNLQEDGTNIDFNVSLLDSSTIQLTLEEPKSQWWGF